MHTLLYVGGRGGQLAPIISHEWPDVASYLTLTSRVFTRKPIRNRCLDFRRGRTSKPSDFLHFNWRQGAAFTERPLLP